MKKAYINKEAGKVLNELLTLFFKNNSTSDNIAYALEYDFGFPHVSDIYHTHIAHAWTGDFFADGIAEIARYMGLRITREGFEGDTKIYNGNLDSTGLIELFNDNLAMVENTYDKITSAIDTLDYDRENKYIVIKLEEMLEALMPILKASNIWAEKAQVYYDHNALYKWEEDFDDMYPLD